MDAIRYGERQEAKERLCRAVEDAADQQSLLDLVEERALARDAMSAADVVRIRADMERATARRLRPLHNQTFFLEAFRHLGRRAHRREASPWEIARVSGRRSPRGCRRPPGQGFQGPRRRGRQWHGPGVFALAQVQFAHLEIDILRTELLVLRQTATC